MPARKTVQVVAAVIEREGKILVCRRAAGDSHPGKWEFPGGKMEPGESPRQALARELREELGIRARIGRRIARATHLYPEHRRVELQFFAVDGFEGEPSNLVFAEIRWERPSLLPEYDFLEADLPLVRSLAAR